ncbi:unnamed protein product [Prorocentrum cordatum]|uniref:CSD domain-containing protein n=1 Tax=Prorocentrum cordatum TaxID=2364126 RepID=A0ABN9T2Q6_9DINO|nr:unnamed protein product [Polarella glacialis]
MSGAPPELGLGYDGEAAAKRGSAARAGSSLSIWRVMHDPPGFFIASAIAAAGASVVSAAFQTSGAVSQRWAGLLFIVLSAGMFVVVSAWADGAAKKSAAVKSTDMGRPGQLFGGSVKRFSAKNGWGLITNVQPIGEDGLTTEPEEQARKDVRFYRADQEALGLEVGALVEFEVTPDPGDEGLGPLSILKGLAWDAKGLPRASPGLGSPLVDLGALGTPSEPGTPEGMRMNPALMPFDFWDWKTDITDAPEFVPAVGLPFQAAPGASADAGPAGAAAGGVQMRPLSPGECHGTLIGPSIWTMVTPGPWGALAVPVGGHAGSGSVGVPAGAARSCQEDEEVQQLRAHYEWQVRRQDEELEALQGRLAALERSRAGVKESDGNGNAKASSGRSRATGPRWCATPSRSKSSATAWRAACSRPSRPPSARPLRAAPRRPGEATLGTTRLRRRPPMGALRPPAANSTAGRRAAAEAAFERPAWAGTPVAVEGWPTEQTLSLRAAEPARVAGGQLPGDEWPKTATRELEVEGCQACERPQLGAQGVREDLSEHALQENEAHHSSMEALAAALWGACPTIAFKLKVQCLAATVSRWAMRFGRYNSEAYLALKALGPMVGTLPTQRGLVCNTFVEPLGACGKGLCAQRSHAGQAVNWRCGPRKWLVLWGRILRANIGAHEL